jgi:hypothetical protein
MNAHERRRFTIIDGLVLIAGLATGLGLVRGMNPDLTPGEVWDALARPDEGWSLRYALLLTLDLGVILYIPFAAGWTPACLLLQLLRPRPRWRRLRRQPGFVSCLIATVVVAVTVAVALAGLAMSAWGVQAFDGDHPEPRLLCGFLAGSGALWGWVTMGLCGACRPSPTWTDRLGRLTGAVWIALGAISALYVLLD